MRITETRLGEVLAHDDHAARVRDADPVAALMVESVAGTHPDHEDAVREAGWFLCDLLGSRAGEGAAPLTATVATHVFAREELTPADAMRAYVARLADRDLLLGVSAQALLRRPVDQPTRRRGHEESEAVLHALYLLLRMFETQEETTALEEAVDGGVRLPALSHPSHDG